MDLSPQRIVCLTEESTELLYLLGEQDRIVGISGFTVRPKEARLEKPKVSTFLDANIQEIVDLKPDLVIGFSDIQAKIAQELIAKGITVWVNNHRSLHETFKMIFQLGSLVNKKQEVSLLIEEYMNRMDQIKRSTECWEIKPKVYFEEWYDPLITGIRWVSELIEIAGGIDVFKDLSKESLAKNRILSNSSFVVQQNPDIILASWCGKKFKPKKMVSRTNWSEITAVQNNEIYEIDSSIILQPGPASISDGLEIIHQIFKSWQERYG